MVGNILENNVVTISGKVSTDLEFSHEVYGEGFYNFIMEVPRLSEYYDMIPVTISERLITGLDIAVGVYIEIEGQFRSYNNYNGPGNKLVLTVFAREIKKLEDKKFTKNPNQVYLNGFICKKPIYRTTPFGREIADILLAVNRAYNKSDYIPCICWGRNARYTEEMTVGDNIKIWGRIQSRNYQKKLDNGDVLNKTAYEVSVTKLDLAGKSQKEEDEDQELEENNNNSNDMTHSDEESNNES
jgi:single-stranded DNA-binding protein